MPPDGVVLGSKLAEILAVTPGDRIMLEVPEGARPIRQSLVAGAIDEPIYGGCPLI